MKAVNLNVTACMFIKLKMQTHFKNLKQTYIGILREKLVEFNI